MNQRGFGAGVGAVASLFVASALVAQAPPAPPPAAAAPVSVVEPPPEPAFDRAVLPAAGRQTALLSIPEFGRYSIAVESPAGTAIQVVDRMAGAGDVAGVAGERDGRVDLFLDRGTVRVVSFGHRLATGDARLAVREFVDRSPETPERLVDDRLVAADLGDLEERSWWIEIAKRRRVVLEAAGRNLADLRLWQNGSWLVAAEPEATEIQPASGRPLGLFRLSADLGPGLYRLTAYGGPSRPWAGGGEERPLFLRSGVARDAVALRERRVVSPFGFDRVRVQGDADYFQLDLAEAGEAELVVADFVPDLPFAEAGATAAISRETMPPVASLEPGTSEDERLVVVRAPAGTPYVLQHFERGEERRLAKAGRWWIGTVAAGAPGDAIDVTALLVELGDGTRPARVVAADVPAIAAGASGWSGRFNLLERTTLFFEVKAAGDYEVRASGTTAQVRVEPFFVTPPDEYRQPPLRPAPAAWSLDPGYYVLELVPVEAGIAEVQIAAKGTSTLAPTPRGAAQLGVVDLSDRREYLVRLNERPGSAAGIVARELPLDLVAALPLAVAPGEEIAVPFRAPSPSRLTGRDEAGAGLDLSVDGGAFAEATEVTAGAHTARVRSTREQPVTVSLALVPAERETAAALPPVSPAALASRPLFPELEPGVPRPFDLERGQAASFRVVAPEPALYRIETTGLLATEAALRTRTQPRLLEEAENGSGRNARLAAYLRDGDYQLTVQPRGASAGHLGLTLSRSPIESGGTLAVADAASAGDGTPRAPARATLAAGSALAYDFEVRESGVYRATARGLKRDFRLRVEDAEGWPPAEPFAEGMQTTALEPGRYRLLVLPQPVEARVSVAVERLPAAESADDLPGDAKTSVVRLPLDREIERTWHEAVAAGARVDDRYRFTLPAAATVAIALSPEMTGELLAPAGREPIARLRPGRGFDGELARGDYELAIRAVRRDEGRRYRLSVRPREWVDGVRRPISPPADLFVSVGAASDVELASYGPLDLKARLFDTHGAEIASGDDRPGDWNFLISRRLEPGRYRLRVESSGTGDAKGGGAPELEMRVPRARAEAALETPGAREVALDEGITVVPLKLARGAGIVAVGARAEDSLGLALEEKQGDSWRTVASAEGRAPVLALSLPREQGELRLRLAALDRRPARARLTAWSGPVARVTEADLARGLDLPRLPGVEPAIAAAVVDLAAPGCFRRAGGDAAPLLQALAMGAPFAPAAPTLAAVGLAMPLAQVADGREAPRVKATRARLGEGEPLSLLVPAGNPLLCDVADGGAAQVEIAATSGEPVVGFVAGSGSWGESTELGAPGSARSSAAAAPGSGRAVELWNAGPNAVEARLDGRLARALAPPAGEVGTVAQSWPVPAGGAVALPLPRGAKSVRLGVSPGAAALLLDGEDAVAYVRAAATGRSETITTGADRVLLFGGPAGSEAALVSVAVGPVDPEAKRAKLERAAGERVERRFLTSGRWRLPVEAGAAPARIEVRGATQAVLVGVDGTVARGDSFRAPKSGGELRLDHGPGFVAVRVEAEGAPAAAVAGGARAQRIHLPAALSLSGDEAAFEVELARPTLLALRSASAFAISASSAGRPLAFETFPSGARFDLFAPAGLLRLGVRGLAGAPLGGAAMVTSSPPLPIREGLGTERMLAPGESEAFVFRVDRAGPIGVGVAADRAGVQARLIGPAGDVLGQGAAIWRDLEAGDYVLLVGAPETGAPARIRTALVGTVPPGDGPPREEIERFLALAGAAPVAARGVVGVEDRPGPESSPPDGEENEEEEELEMTSRVAAAEDER